MSPRAHQRLPGVRTKSHGLHEPLSPIGRDHGAVLCLPKERPERPALDLAQDGVVAAQDRAKDGAGLHVVIKDRLVPTPDVRQPLAWHHHHRADRDPGEKAIEVGQHHALGGRLVREQVGIKEVEISIGDGEIRCTHGLAPGEPVRFRLKRKSSNRHPGTFPRLPS